MAAPSSRPAPDASENALSNRSAGPLLDDDLDAAVLGFAHAVAGRDQQLVLAAADHPNSRLVDTLAHQRILHRGGAPLGKRLVIGAVARGVGVARDDDPRVRPGLCR